MPHRRLASQTTPIPSGAIFFDTNAADATSRLLGGEDFKIWLGSAIVDAADLANLDSSCRNFSFGAVQNPVVF